MTNQKKPKGDTFTERLRVMKADLLEERRIITAQIEKCERFLAIYTAYQTKRPSRKVKK